MNPRYKPKSKQNGVALFITLLVVTIATLLATEMWFNNTLDVARQFNNQAAYQANHYAKGMVLWAQDVLRQDFEVDSSFDSSSDPWNQAISGVVLEDAVLSGKLIDLNGKFNLNNLVINGIEEPQSIAYFQRILRRLELDIGIADKIIDWLDADQIPKPLGAEDTVYLAKSPSYRSAGQNFVHISELRLIDGINEQIYQRLKSFVTVYPIVNNLPSKVNINTSSTLLILALDDSIQIKDALIVYNNGSASYKTLASFFTQPAIQYYNLNRENLSQIISTRSVWFQAEINVKMEQSNFQNYALVYRLSAFSVVKQWSQTAYY